MSLKIQGMPSAPLPIMTPWQPVVSIMCFASCGDLTSPLPMTGMLG